MSVLKKYENAFQPRALDLCRRDGRREIVNTRLEHRRFFEAVGYRLYGAENSSN